MKNLHSYDDHLFEKVQSSFLRDLLKDQKAKEELTYYLKVSDISDKDIIELSDPSVITKKPYSTDYLILVMGEYKTDKRNPEVDNHYSKNSYLTKYGLCYTIRNTDVNVVNGEYGYSGGRRGHREAPKRNHILNDKDYNENPYKYYAIKYRTLKKGDDDYAWSDLQLKRNKRQRDQAGTSTKMDRKDFNDRVAKQNRDRYAKQLSTIKDFGFVFNRIEELMDKANEFEKLRVRCYKYIAKANGEINWEQKNKIEEALYVPLNVLKALHEFTYKIKEKEGEQNHYEILREVSNEVSDLLGKEHVSENDINKVKKIFTILKTFPIDPTPFEEFITDNSWRDSDKLKSINKNTGIFES